MTQQAAAAIGIYASLNVLILLWLTLATSQLRGRYKVLVGDNGVPHLIRIMRGHANAVENMPMMMVLMLVAALLGTPVLVLHLLGVTFTVGRALHAWHFILEKGEKWQRFVGFGLSFLAMLLATFGVLGHALLVLAG
jgi:uncharacterized membrane protein YecN with MAPEG domain